MAIDLRISQKMLQSLVMTPQLQQAIKLLQLNRMELMEVINQELVDNPVLDEGSEAQNDEPTPENENESGEELETREAQDAPTSDADQNPAKEEDINWENYMDDASSYNQSTAPSMKESVSPEDLPNFENALTKTTSLEDHLFWQLSMVPLQDAEKKLGELILGNLTDEGFLEANIVDLAKETGMELEDAEEVLKLIQTFDPIGVGARNLQECLLIQARFLNPRQPLVELIIQNHLSELERKNYTAISRALSEPIDRIIDATKVILEFEPKPGRSFVDNDTHYITPDIYVYKVGQDYTISLNEDGLPKLRISPYYKGILSAQKGATKEYVQEKLRAALWLIKSIHNRQKTIYRVTEAIVQRQKDFFEKGVHCLRPMVLKDIAADVGMHESTISRVTTNKYVHTPVGIFELKYFFNSSINSSDGADSVASEAVKEKIRDLIKKEDPKNPLSDQKLVELLSQQNIDIARRTVAKYREMLGINSSGRRKKVF